MLRCVSAFASHAACAALLSGLWANMPEGRELQPRYHGEHAVRGAKQHPSDRGRFEYGLSIHFQR